MRKASARSRFNAVFLALGLYALGDAVAMVMGLGDVNAQAARFGLSADLESVRRVLSAVIGGVIGVGAGAAVVQRLSEHASWSRWALVVPVAQGGYALTQIGFALFSAQFRLLLIVGLIHAALALLARASTRFTDPPA